MAVGFTIRYNQAQFKKLSQKLSPDETKQVVHQTTDEVSEFFKRKMQDYPPQKRVTRQQAYGKTFFTDKQRRWFFGALNRGELEIPYRRTKKLAEGWTVLKGTRGERSLTNITPYAPLVQDRSRQSRMMKIIGWRTVSYYLWRYASEIGRVGLVNVRRWAAK